MVDRIRITGMGSIASPELPSSPSPFSLGRGARGEGKTIGLRLILLTAFLVLLPRSIARAADPDDLNQLLQYGYCTACDLSGADLSGMNFAGAVLTGSIFTGANLSGANLQQTDLSHAIFNAANLSGTDFSFANLSNASLAGALMRPAANFTGADLRGAVMPGGAIRSNTDAPQQPQIGTTIALPETRPAVPTDRLEVNPLGEEIPLPTTNISPSPTNRPAGFPDSFTLDPITPDWRDNPLPLPTTNPANSAPQTPNNSPPLPTPNLAAPTPQNTPDLYQANPIPRATIVPNPPESPSPNP